MDNAIEDLLQVWEETYKRGLLSFWMLLLLSERPSYPYEMSLMIKNTSRESISVDDNSIYRALNRFEGIGIVQSELRDGEAGPQRKYYELTSKGLTLLREFIKRNILVFEDPTVANLIQSVLENERASV